MGTPNETGRRRSWQGAALALVLGVAVQNSGCTAPAVEGYQIQDIPQGFLYAQLDDAAPLLPGREVERSGVWLGDIKMNEPQSTMEVLRYRGPVAREEAEAAWAARAERLANARYNILGPVRPLTRSDGGEAWAWTEERHDEYGRFRSLTVTAVVPFDTVGFSLEFYTTVPERMTAAAMDPVLASFGIGRTVVHWKIIYALVAGVMMVVVLLWRRGDKPRAGSYRLWEGTPGSTSSPSSTHPTDPNEAQDAP